jgi:hypothetical protein
VVLIGSARGNGSRIGLKSYGVDGAKTFPAHKIGNPPGDASRVMWPAFAKAAGIAPDSVTFVDAYFASFGDLPPLNRQTVTKTIIL